MKNKNEYTIAQACTEMEAGQLTSKELVGACLSRIHERDAEVMAWTTVDDRAALELAAQRDCEDRRSVLHGIPFGAKDIIDTKSLPTTYGNKRHLNHFPECDAEIITRLEELGAVMIGKNVTTEFACYAPGPTRNPNNLEHTPGGSSSGSAAAVSDKHVLFALGTQTAGSMIRPGSFNGAVAFKPSFGTLSYRGVHTLSPTLDTLGLFTNSIGDQHLLLSALAPHLRISEGNANPQIAVVRTPWWPDADEEMKVTFDAYVERLRSKGVNCEDIALPDAFTDLRQAQELIMALEGSRALNEEYTNHRSSLDPKTIALIERGQGYSPDEECNARNVAARCRYLMDEIFRDYDLILTLAAPGPAPRGLEATGDPIFNRVWTLLGLPCLSYPISRNAENLPLGVQFIAQFGQDHSLIKMTNKIKIIAEQE